MFDHELDHAVRAFQQHRGLLVDGIVGEATYRALKEASYRLGARTLNHQFGAPMYGDDVATLQARLQDLGFYTGLVDGHFGLQTHNALMSYQREYGLSPDGICGPETLRSLYFLGSRVTGGSPHAIREEELVRRSGPRLSGKRIIIDPGRGGNDHGLIMQGPAGPISEADILWDLASRLEGRMTAIGMETFLSRPANRSPSDAERAATANTVGADLMISLRCAAQASPSANGVASFHFGNSHGSVSTIGRNLADFIQREVVARTGLRDCRTHGRTWDLLRLTRMPTVQVDVGYITNPRDRGMLVYAAGSRLDRRRHPRRGQAAVPARQERPAHGHIHVRRAAGPRTVGRAGRPRQPDLIGSAGTRARTDGLLQLRGLQQALQRRLDIGLPAQPLLELEPKPREVAVVRDDDEPGVLQQVGVEHALVDRAVPEHLDDGPQLWRHQSRVQQLGRPRRCARTLRVPARRGAPDRRRPPRSGCRDSPLGIIGRTRHRVR